MAKSHSAAYSGRAESPGQAYFANIAVRAFIPLGVCRLPCPLRKRCWVLSPNIFDPRAAQSRRDIEPRGGPMFSAPLENAHGRIALSAPTDGVSLGRPEALDFADRISRFPRRADIIFENERPRLRISFRPLKGPLFSRSDAAYDPGVYTDGTQPRPPSSVFA